MLRLRVSTLDSFMRVLTTDYAQESELIDRMKRGQWTDSDKGWMPRAGSAFHKCCEDPIGTSEIAFDEQGKPFKRHRSGDYFFAPDAVEGVRRLQGPGIRELKAVKVMAGVEIEGTTDHIRGLYLRDIKTKFTTIDARSYEDSLQWRFYLWLHDCEAFTYDLCAFKEPQGVERMYGDNTDVSYEGDPTGFCELREVASVRFWRYPGMEAELTGWVRRFREWASDRGLLNERRAA